MMPTFPSPPLKFRTVGFPQYGFKASVSDRAFRPRVPVKRVPRIPRSADTFTLPFVHSHDRVKPPGPSVQVNHRPRAWTAVPRGLPSLPQGSLAPAGVMLSACPTGPSVPGSCG